MYFYENRIFWTNSLFPNASVNSTYFPCISKLFIISWTFGMNIIVYKFYDFLTVIITHIIITLFIVENFHRNNIMCSAHVYCFLRSNVLKFTTKFSVRKFASEIKQTKFKLKTPISVFTLHTNTHTNKHMSTHMRPFVPYWIICSLTASLLMLIGFISYLDHKR